MRVQPRIGPGMKFKMKGGNRRPFGARARGVSRHAFRTPAHRAHINSVLMMFKQKDKYEFDLAEKLDEPVPVLMHSTQTPPWVRKERQRRRNAMQRRSRRLNRR